jgi:hypothetical protein
MVADSCKLTAPVDVRQHSSTRKVIVDRERLLRDKGGPSVTTNGDWQLNLSEERSLKSTLLLRYLDINMATLEYLEVADDGISRSSEQEY